MESTNSPIPPKGFAQIYQRLIEAVQVADFPKVMQLQTEANDLLRAENQPAYDLPEAYFRLTYEMMQNMGRDDARMNEISTEMGEILRQAGCPVLQESDVPEECRKLLERSQEAAKSGDSRKSIRLTQEYDGCMKRHGFDGFGLPDEYYDLQVEAQDAFEAGDLQKFQQLCQRSERIMNERGIFNVGNAMLDQ